MSRIPASRPDLAAVVRTLRSERGLTQEEVGARAGLHPVHISMIESGKRVPGIRTFDRLLSALGVTWTEVGPLLDRIRCPGSTP